ncbi:uncharacterized protein LOC117590840 [Drosophila guanche]|uniref:Uncharacterized protein n=1 Tax=Drosophila guanche TaxID=7266 RepID=A0A3B0K513_DROGU|nr:uncharacterized protein LOC117590840 [Drosophila guanche]SPP89235.1 Hypothetical predicted protein [Drosophila guanche]
MNRLHQQVSSCVGLEVLQDVEKSQLVHYRSRGVYPNLGNSKLTASKISEMATDVISSQLALDEPLDSAPHANNFKLDPEILPELEKPKVWYDESPEIPPDCDNSNVARYEVGEICQYKNNSQAGTDGEFKICTYEASPQSLELGPLHDDDDDSQSGVQIIEIFETPRGVPKVTRERAEITMIKKRFQAKEKAYRELVARHHELYAIYKEKRRTVAEGLAEITKEMEVLGYWADDATAEGSEEDPEECAVYDPEGGIECEQGYALEEGPEKGPEQGADGHEVALVKVDSEPKSSDAVCAIC